MVAATEVHKAKVPVMIFLPWLELTREYRDLFVALSDVCQSNPTAKLASSKLKQIETLMKIDLTPCPG